MSEEKQACPVCSNNSKIAEFALSDFPARLKKAIEKSGIAQSELARRIGCSQETLSRYCHGKFFPTQKRLFRLARELNVTPEELVNSAMPKTPHDAQEWKSRALAAEHKLESLEKQINGLFSQG